MIALPPAPQPGEHISGERVPPRTYRGRPMYAAGIVTRVHPHALEIVNADGFRTIAASTARRTR